ncbi:hypothetical protein KLEP7_gp187 [Pseudaeromonas phage vB_PpeM_ KLEP7]|nr:hypothetical protein KLEP7_gp187 [Pseudaeromonas phage vB_PpeM_ KLEP7]
MTKTEKKWYEFPKNYPPIDSIVLAEFNTVKGEYFKVKILSYDTDGQGYGVVFMWLEGPAASITQKIYNASYFKPLLPIENKEEKDSPKQEKSLDNLLKELHNLKQEHNENLEKSKKTFVDMNKVLKEINELAESLGIEIIIK